MGGGGGSVTPQDMSVCVSGVGGRVTPQDVCVWPGWGGGVR